MQAAVLFDQRATGHDDDIVIGHGRLQHFGGVEIRVHIIARHQYRAVDDQEVGIGGCQPATIVGMDGGAKGKGNSSKGRPLRAFIASSSPAMPCKAR